MSTSKNLRLSVISLLTKEKDDSISANRDFTFAVFDV